MSCWAAAYITDEAAADTNVNVEPIVDNAEAGLNLSIEA